MKKKTGTLDNPIVVNSAGDEQFAGCTGSPADSHVTIWCGVSLPLLSNPPSLLPSHYSSPTQMSRARPVERCAECGSVYRMEYIGPPDDPHAHHGDHHGDASHNYEEPKTMADYVRPEYRGTPQPFYGQS